jgi:hypothetical protein
MIEVSNFPRRNMDSAKLQISKPVISLMVVLAAITFYWMFTYSGPYRYLAELELKWLGSYSVAGTFLLVAFGWALLFGIVSLLLFGVRKDMAARFRSLTSKQVLMHQDIWAAMPPAWVRLRLARFVALLTCLGMGAWYFYSGATAGALQQLDAADFQSGKLHSRVVYADVRGRLSQKYLANDEDEIYIPMAGSAGPSAPIRVIVSTTRSQMRKQIRGQADGIYTVRGIADKWLPADIKYTFAKNGYTLADSVWVVRAGHSPSSDRQMALIALALGIVLAGIIKHLENRARRRVALSPVTHPGT